MTWRGLIAGSFGIYDPYIKRKINKTSNNSRRSEKVENLAEFVVS